ncbi:MAG: NUDIX hydrolase [Anaerolineales bacterium]|nr:NUDIX hydrolase [Anaerolineales bacterium]
MPESAPAEVKFCSRCGTAMVTERRGDRPRRVCPACGYVHFTDPKVGVGVVVLHEGKLLLVRRTMNPERGKWSLPAGFLDAGEDPAATAIREAYEETNLEIAISGLIDVYFNPPRPDGGASIFILYAGQLRGGQLQAGDDADAAGFFGPDELPELAFASTQAMVNRIFGAQAS